MGDRSTAKPIRLPDRNAEGVVRCASFAMVPAWLARDPKVTDRAVRVYAVLGSIGPVAFAGWEHLADLCGECSVSTIGRALQVLREVGAVRITPQFRADGFRTTNVYELARDQPFDQVAQVSHFCDDGSLKSDLPANANLTAQELEKSELEKSELHKPRRRSSTADGQGSLSIVPEPDVPKAKDHVARGVLEAVWEYRKQRGEPVPGNYIAALGVVKKLLAAGNPADRVLTGCVQAPTISVGAVEIAMRNGPKAAAGPAQWDNSLRDSDAGVGFVQREPGKSRKLTDDERRKVQGLDQSGVGHG